MAQVVFVMLKRFIDGTPVTHSHALSQENAEEAR